MTHLPAAAHLDERENLPTHHIRPATGWMNDPNGPVLWRGRYHIFFQYNPVAPIHQLICWGHASSPDLLVWDYEPIALTPTPDGADAAGCWSGCVVADGNVATAVYTAATTGPDTASICTATSTDERLTTWVKRDDRAAQAPAARQLLGFRDPFVFNHGGVRYGIVGAGEQPGRRAMILLYECNDLHQWTYLGVLLDATDHIAHSVAAGDVWECPQLFRMGSDWVLIVSLVRGPHLTRVVYLVGDLVTAGTGLHFAPQSGDLVDHGHDFYAPAVLLDRDRILLWGWTWEDRPAQAISDAGWAGALTLPRELGLTRDRLLRSRPLTELSALRGESSRHMLTPQHQHAAMPARPLDVNLLVDTSSDGQVTLQIFDDLLLHLDSNLGTAELHRTVHERTRQHWPTVGHFPPGDTAVNVRMILDGSIVEIFVEDGPTFTERVYQTGSPTLRLLHSHEARCAVRAWTLPARREPSIIA